MTPVHQFIGRGCPYRSVGIFTGENVILQIASDFVCGLHIGIHLDEFMCIFHQHLVKWLWRNRQISWQRVSVIENVEDNP